MGGTNETVIKSLRMHVNDTEGKVHVHDDGKGLKFTASTRDFKSEMSKALKSLDKTDGIVSISGDTSVRLLVLHDGKSFHTFLADDTSNKKDLETFIKDI